MGRPKLNVNLAPSTNYSAASSKTVVRGPDGKVVAMGNTPSTSTGKTPSTSSSGSSSMDKANTLFNGLNLAALPFFFIPFGGAAAGSAAGQAFDPAQALPSAICVSSSSMMVTMVVVLIVMTM